MFRSTYYSGTKPQTWKEALATIKAAQDEFTQYSGIMTDYERSVIQRDIAERKKSLQPVIVSGVLAEHAAALREFQRAGNQANAERVKEINRWDTVKLVGEMQAYKFLVDQVVKAGDQGSVGGPSIAQALERIYSEARQSGDMHKQRAAAEILKSTVHELKSGGFENNRLEVNHLSHQAERDLQALRTTDAIHEADERAGQAFNQYMQVLDQVREVGKALDGYDPLDVFATGPLARAARRIKRDPQTGEVTVYPEDHPEVTGIDLSKMTQGESK